MPIDFFFSSRRRHTRWNCDWSSDVCSSDLRRRLQPRAWPAARERGDPRGHQPAPGEPAMSPSGADAKEAPKYTKKDFESDQDVRWCPGCGDYAILSAVQKAMPDLGIP